MFGGSTSILSPLDGDSFLLPSGAIAAAAAAVAIGEDGTIIQTANYDITPIATSTSIMPIGSLWRLGGIALILLLFAFGGSAKACKER